MNLPNRLTVARLLLVPLFMIFTYTDNVYTRILALLIFIGAGITDLYDGYLARKYNLITPLGTFLDPLADKLIVTAAFISFVELPEIHIPAWMVVLIVGREFLITGLRSLAAAQGRIIGADEGGKFKTTVQITAILTILVTLIINSALGRFGEIDLQALHAEPGWRAASARLLEWTPYWMAFIATLFSLITGVGYLRQHKALLRQSA
jgi:CDP-diacylglycerol---glycerol-3-phosphate 3-phosphatidyltransferase